MSKNKKLGLIIGIVAVIFCVGIIIFFFPKQTLTQEGETSKATESHLLSATLNQKTYVIAYSDSFDISQVNVNVTADSITTVLFADGSTSKNYDTLGEHLEQIEIKDTFDNIQTVEITIQVIDTVAPVIKGVTDCSIIEDSRFTALGGVTAIDDVDGNVSNTLVCSEYNINTVGTQTLTITATDNSGNIGSFEFTLTVNEKPVVKVKPPAESTIASTRNIYEAPLDGIEHDITCWGDSLTVGTGASNAVTINGISGATMPSTLASLTGRKVYNMGVYGEDSKTIAARQGGLPMYVNNFTIPAKGSVSFSKITITKEDNVNTNDNTEDINQVTPCTHDWPGNPDASDCFNPCLINGITGTLTYDRGKPLPYTFTRTTPGKEMIINSYTEIVTQASIDRKNDILILQIGNNGGWNYNTETLIAQYDAMIAKSTCKYYIIVGDTDYSAEERAGWEAALQWAYGKHFINMREYLSANGLQDCGLTPTAQDLELMAVGAVPYSLKAPDETHLTSYGYWVEGNVIYKKGVELGYWK